MKRLKKSVHRNNIALHTKRIKSRLGDIGKPQRAKKTWKYFKNDMGIKFRGITSPDLKVFIKNYWDENELKSSITIKEQKEVGFELLRSEFGEDRYAGVELLKKNITEISVEDLDTMGDIIDEFHVDWGSIDSLASGLIRRVLEKKPTCEPIIEQWSLCDVMWRQRSSCIAFVCLGKTGKYNDRIMRIAENCLNSPQSNERFLQLGVGWVLRELSTADIELVVRYLITDYDKFSREGLRYAIEKFSPPLRTFFMKFNKSSLPDEYKKLKDSDVEYQEFILGKMPPLKLNDKWIERGKTSSIFKYTKIEQEDIKENKKKKKKKRKLDDDDDEAEEYVDNSSHLKKKQKLRRSSRLKQKI